MFIWATARLLARCAIVALLAIQVGCHGLCQRSDPPTADQIAPVTTISQCQKNKVYLFFIHGCDPLDCSNFSGLRDYVQSIGFIKTYFGNSYHTFFFEKELRRLRKDQPDVRFVLVGYGRGADMARDLACSLRQEGICFDLAVFLDGQGRSGHAVHRPSNVARVVNVVSCKHPEGHLDGAENHHFDDVGHLGLATDRRTLTLMAQELASVALQVPLPPHTTPVLEPVGPMLPAPKEVPQSRSEWDFLRPDEYARGGAGLPPTEQAFHTFPSTMPRR